MSALVAEEKDVSGIMHEALLPTDIDFFGIGVNPSFYSALIVTCFLLVCGVIIRVFVIPHFKRVPGKFQLFLETAVGFFENLAETNSPYHNGFVGAYIFSAGMFIFFGTLIELIGFRAVMGDLNVCIVMGFMSYGVILAGGIRYNKFHGALETLRNFSLPFSMSFRLFGAIIGGVLVNELIYDGFSILSMTVILPVFVSVMFTLMHAVVQTYILTLLTSMFFGTSSAPYEKAVKKRRRKKEETVSA